MPLSEEILQRLKGTTTYRKFSDLARLESERWKPRIAGLPGSMAFSQREQHHGSRSLSFEKCEIRLDIDNGLVRFVLYFKHYIPEPLISVIKLFGKLDVSPRDFYAEILYGFFGIGQFVHCLLI